MLLWEDALNYLVLDLEIHCNFVLNYLNLNLNFINGLKWTEHEPFITRRTYIIQSDPGFVNQQESWENT